MIQWLSFDKIEKWPDAVILGFQYDDIADRDIKKCLRMPEVLAQQDVGQDWEDDWYLDTTREIPLELKHAARVAAIVDSIQSGNKLTAPITLDSYAARTCKSAIPNGHHRIRALQYLGAACAPFELGGNLDSIEALIKVAGVKPPRVSDWFEQSLLA